VMTFVDATDPKFIPMSNVRVRWVSDRKLAARYPFALLQRNQILGVATEGIKLGGAETTTRRVELLKAQLLASTDAGTDALAMCGTETNPSEGLSCNALVATGGCVTATVATGAAPAGSGGTIETGTYDLVSITLYPGDAGAFQVLSPVRKTVTIAHGTAGAFDTQEVDAAGTYLRRQNGSITVSGSMLTFTPTCPTTDGGNNGAGTVGFTFTPGATATLAVVEPHGNNASVVEVYQKR
jgi:hypothetical protein